MPQKWLNEETDNPLFADDRNFYKVEKWTKDGSFPWSNAPAKTAQWQDRGSSAGTDERPDWTTPVLTEIEYTDELRQLYRREPFVDDAAAPKCGIAEWESALSAAR